MKEFSIHRVHSLHHYLSSRPFLRLAFTTAIMICIFIIINRWISAVTALPQESYFEPFLAIELLANLFSSPLKGILSSLIFGFILLRFKYFWVSWSQINESSLIRLFIVLLAAILCWWYVTYDYNLYVNQAHYYDRFLLVALLFLMAWRPFFILPFLLLLTTIIWQFTVPLKSSYSFAQPSMPLRMLTLFVAMMFYSSLTGEKLGKQKLNEWIFLSLCIIAAHYWVPGIAKMALNWATYGHVFYLLPSTYANGWLAFLTPSQLSSFALTLAKFDGFIVASTLVLQLSALFLLWKRFSLFVLLTCWTLFHIGIFATSGIFFWQWIIIELAIVILIRKQWRNDPLPFINRNHFILSVLLISTSIFWLRPVGLAWYDTPVSYTFRFEATGESGQPYTLPPRFFTPYDYAFTLGKFNYLVPEPRLDIMWGATSDRDTANQLLQAKTKDAIFKAEKESGHSTYDSNQSEIFDNFIRRFVLNINERGSKSTLFSVIQAPRQLWTFTQLKNMEYDFQEPISTVNVYQVTSWFDGKNYHEIETKRVRQIMIKEKS